MRKQRLWHRATPATLEKPPPLRAERNSAQTERAVEVAAVKPRRVINPWLVAALAVTIGSFIINEVGVKFGLPNHLHWDEPIIVNRAMRMGSGDLNPHYFDYPSLVMYAVLVAESGLYAVGRLLHWYGSAQGFAFYYLTDSTAVFVVARSLIALAGAGATFLCYSVARRFFSSQAVGLLAAALLAVSPAFVGSAHFVTTDVPMAFFVLLAYRFIWDVYRQGSTRSFVLAGAAIGLGIATKYLPAILLLTVALAQFLGNHARTGRRLPSLRDLSLTALAVGCAALAFFVTSPYSVIDFRAAIHDYMATAAIASAGGCGGCQPNFVPFLTFDLGWAAGWPVYLLSLTGLASISWIRGERRLRYLILASFPILLFLVVGAGRNAFARYLVPLTPFMAMAASAQIIWLVAWFRQRLAISGPHSGRVVAAVAAVLVAICLIPTGFASASFDSYLSRPDSRVSALAWFDANVPGGTSVSVQPMANRYFLNAPIMTDAQLAIVEGYLPPSMGHLKSRVDQYYQARPIYRSVAFVYDLDQLRADGAAYVVISSATYHVAGDAKFYADLERRGRLVARFAPTMSIPDARYFPVTTPTISIYRVDAGG
jgi:hypothetical protein